LRRLAGSLIITKMPQLLTVVFAVRAAEKPALR
jgi:hypothetical protein